jgi:alpha-L-rhamnosidase
LVDQTKLFQIKKKIIIMHPINLTCESIESPINIDSKHPRLSWKFLVDKNEFAKYQTAYHILVASSEQLLEQNIGDLWDS